LIFALAFGSREISAQFDEIAVPEQMAALNFMVGDWDVDGVFRTPDHIHTDRTLWYLTRGGGITQFDGRVWTTFSKGESSLADLLLAQTSTRAQPYRFANLRSVKPIQDGFAMLLDEGRTSGSAVIYFDTERAKWVATQFHAPTNSVTTSNAFLIGPCPTNAVCREDLAVA